MGTEKRGKVSLWTLCGILLGLLLLLFPGLLIRGLALICGIVCAVFGIRSRFFLSFGGGNPRNRSHFSQMGIVIPYIPLFLCFFG